MNFHVVLGAGPLARATAEALRGEGKPVRVISRGGVLPGAAPEVETRKADLLGGRQAAEAAAGAQALYFCAQPPYNRWPEEFPRLQAAAIDLAERTGARLVVAENLYAYGRVSGSITEDLPLRPNSRKGRVRAEMHEALMKAHASGRISAVVARGSDFFGPHVEASSMGGRQFRALLQGKPVEVMGDPDTRHSYTYVQDFGRALAMLGEADGVLGQVWHVPNAPALSTRGFLERAAAQAGTKLKLQRLGPLVLTLVGLFNPIVRELKEMAYEWEEPFVVSHEKFARRFGDSSTPHDQALAATVAWYRAQG